FGLWAPYLHDSTLTLDPGHALVPDRGTTVLANLTLDGNLDATLWVGYYDYNSGLLQIYGGLTLNGTPFLGAADGSTYDDIFFYGAQSLDGNGAIVFGNNGNNQLHIASSATTLTLGPNWTVHGASGFLHTVSSDNRFDNRGTIAADAGGQI